jgi:hypothetical protein
MRHSPLNFYYSQAGSEADQRLLHRTQQLLSDSPSKQSQKKQLSVTDFDAVCTFPNDLPGHVREKTLGDFVAAGLVQDHRDSSGCSVCIALPVLSHCVMLCVGY